MLQEKIGLGCFRLVQSSYLFSEEASEVGDARGMVGGGQKEVGYGWKFSAKRFQPRVCEGLRQSVEGWSSMVKGRLAMVGKCFVTEGLQQRACGEEMFIGLLLRAMKNDINLKRVSAFSKRLLQVALQQPPQYACGCLFLLSEVLKARPPLWHMVLQNESIDEDLEHFEDIVEEPVNQIITKSSEPDNACETIRSGDGTDADSDSLQDENVSLTFDSDSDGSDEAVDLLFGGGSEDAKEIKSVADQNRQQPQVSDMRSSLPGGYNPRHREPSYWYFHPCRIAFELVLTSRDCIMSLLPSLCQCLSVPFFFPDIVLRKTDVRNW
ncbi:hypothetical protein U1Q18_046671 [Sarracenia purpurea var. burkii]